MSEIDRKVFAKVLEWIKYADEDFHCRGRTERVGYFGFGTPVGQMNRFLSMGREVSIRT
jgi:hypothetical protein